MPAAASSSVAPAPAPAARARQAPAHVVMVRPHRFSVNPATAADNAFQERSTAHSPPAATMAGRAYTEATRLARTLDRAGVVVRLFDDETGHSPDSVFCNNWFTTHPDGRVLLCPMYAPNRRQERRADVVAHLREQFDVTEVLDWTDAEHSGQFLEGTGSVVIDHIEQVAYGCRSQRLTPELFYRFCREFDLQPVLFDALDTTGRPIFHTNVMMSVGESFAVIASESIPDAGQRADVVHLLGRTGRTVVELAGHQIKDFAGNVLELRGTSGSVLAMSTTARAALRSDQIDALHAHSQILAVDVSTVEAAGGSVRCMLAGIHLPQ